jgi:hypothetical protein
VDDDSRALLGAAFGGLGSIGAAALLVGVRGHFAPVNVALVLVLFVLLGAVVGGRWAGIVSALAAGISFDFFHTKPYGSLKISQGTDIQTTVLLVLVGIAVGVVAAHGDRIRTVLRDQRGELRRVHRVAELAAAGESLDDLVSTITAELIDVLHLRSCSFERPPFATVLTPIEPNGTFPTHEYRFARGGFELPREGVALPVQSSGEVVGRFALVPTPGAGVSLERRLVAVAMADQLGVVLGRAAA